LKENTSNWLSFVLQPSKGSSPDGAARSADAQLLQPLLAQNSAQKYCNTSKYEIICKVCEGSKQQQHLSLGVDGLAFIFIWHELQTPRALSLAESRARWQKVSRRANIGGGRVS